MFNEERTDWFEDIIGKYRLEGHENLIKPSFGTGSIADIPNLLKTNLGIETGKPVPQIMKGCNSEVDHMVFLLLDGFGHSTIEYALNNYKVPNLRKFMEKCEYTPITSVFPSTTSTSTVTYQTDLHPVEHGIIGYNAYLSEIGAVCNMISLTPIGRHDYSLLDHGWNVPVIESKGTIYNEFSRNMIDPYLYLPRGIRGSGMTRITGKGAGVTGYISVPQMFTVLKRNIEKSVRKSFHFCYVPTIDTISHEIGPFTEETAMEMDSIFQLLNDQFIDELKPDGEVGIAISADHGHTVIPWENIRDVQDDRILASLLRTPAMGEFRAPILRIKPGRLEEALQHLEAAYGGDYLIKRSSEMLEEGFFGVTSGENANPERFGDIIMIPITNVGLKDSSLGVLDQKLNQFKLIGIHGGLSYDEMIVPLIFRKLGGQ